MRIALIQPDSPYLAYPFAFPSLGLLYISAYLKEHGLKPDFYDLTGGGKLPDIRADVIAFSCQITQYPAVVEMRDRLKKTNPDAMFVIGGPYPTHTFCPKFYNIQGEGEIPFARLLGLSGNQYANRGFLPDWEAIDLDKYGYSLEGKRCINIMTKRGNCPYRCAFCAKQENGKSPLRFRSLQHIMMEVDYLRSRGFGALAIYDDDVLIKKERDVKIFECLKEREMPYRCMTRTDLATKEDLQMLKETGCAEVAVGIETADEKIHRVVNKGTTLEQDSEFMRNAKAVGLRVKAYLMIGLPGESMESVEKTRRWLRVHKPENYDLSIFTPYPGSHIYSNKKLYDIRWDKKRLQKLWYSGAAQYEDCAVSTSHLTSAEIVALKKATDAEFKRGKAGSTSYWKPL